MPKTPTTLDDLFNEHEAEQAAKPAPAPTPVEELKRRLEEHQRLLDEAGPEPEDDDENVLLDHDDDEEN